MIGEVISLESLGRIVEKCSVNASGIPDGVGNSQISSSTDEVFYDVSSLIVCQVRQGSFLCSLNDSL